MDEQIIHIDLFSKIDNDSEFIPLITAEEEESVNNQAFPEELPILPLRNNVLFPGVVIPITVGRDKSIKLIQDSNKGNKIIGVVSQKNQEQESPNFNDLHTVGTVAQIIRLLKMPDGSSTVIIQGKRRFEIETPLQTEPYMKAKVKVFKETSVSKKDKELSVMINTIKELDKLQRMNPQGAEYTVQMNFLDVMLDLPWNEYTKDNLDLKRAKKILERDHAGLEKVKERILEYLAVLKIRGNMKSPILCFYGPPGVGKTSLGKSIAEALGRKYVRMSLGGLHDEAEIRGHRKTYIGAMPGRVIQSLKKAESANPVFVLDEIDKLGRGFHGDPSSALLEVLDPEQNGAFYDNYVENEFDLSKVLFIATANSLGDIQGPLRDRMEIIEVNGYTVEEKIEIGKKHLIPKQLKEHGLNAKEFDLEKAALEQVILSYTNESGVRGLDKQLAKLVRSRAKQIANEESYEVVIKASNLFTFLGAGRNQSKSIVNDVAGVVTGLAWTAVGGDILFIESSISQGNGKLTLTGNLGDVMKESAVIALAFLKSHSDWLSLPQAVFNDHDVHLHVPEGATPKDGPSAGITMLTSLASLFTQRKVKKDLAMTGEITLRGEVLPDGGIKEKLLAAKRSGIKEVIMSSKNKQDVEEIEARYLKGLKIHYVEHMKSVLDLALMKEKVAEPIIIEPKKKS